MRIPLTDILVIVVLFLCLVSLICFFVYLIGVPEAYKELKQ